MKLEQVRIEARPGGPEREAEHRKDALGHAGHFRPPPRFASPGRARSHSAQKGTPFRVSAVSAADCALAVRALRASDRRSVEVTRRCAVLRKTTILPMILPWHALRHLPPAALASAPVTDGCQGTSSVRTTSPPRRRPSTPTIVLAACRSSWKSARMRFRKRLARARVLATDTRPRRAARRC